MMEEVIVSLRCSDNREILAENIWNAVRYVLQDNLVELKVLILDPVIQELAYVPLSPTIINADNDITVCALDAQDILEGCGSQERRNPELKKLSNVKNIKCIFSKFTDTNEAISWPISDTQGDEIIGQILLLVKTFDSSICDALEQLSNSVSLAYDRVYKEMLKDRKLSALKTIGNVFHEDLGILSKQIIVKLTNELDAESGTIFVIDRTSEDLYTNVLGDKVLEDDYRIPIFESGFMFLYSQPNSQFFEITQDTAGGNEQYGDERWQSNQDSQIGSDIRKLVEFSKQEFQLNSMLVVPAVNEGNNEIIAFVCLLNKKGGKRFTTLDRELMLCVVNNCTPMILNALFWKTEMMRKKQTESLLEVAKNLFTSLDDVGVLLRKIMEEARKMTKAERCSLFLVDHEREELVAKVFDGINHKDDDEEELRIPIIHGVVGHVATTGKLLNIRDAYSHPLFYKQVDSITGFKTRNILCFPIKGENGVVGVAQLCNKINGSSFTKFDEELTAGFAVFCGLGLVQSLLYKKAMDAQQRSCLSNEMMMYHMRTSMPEVERYTVEPFPSKQSTNTEMDSLNFMPRIQLAPDDNIKVVLAMFHELGFIERFKLRESTVVRFVLTCRKGYRNPPYHNWTHAWTVAHFSYLLFKNTTALGMLTDLDVFALFISCLCHDLDHRGTTNSFQIASKSVLAALYSSQGAVMEQHHFTQAMHIVNSEGCNIFGSLSEKEYSKALDLMRFCILATDLVHHFKIMKQLEELPKVGYNKSLKEHRNLLLSIMMTASDLSDQTKSWESTIKVSNLLYAEFFDQGDMEKSMGYKPKDMMDRDKASVPSLQVDFLSHVAQPCYRLLAGLLPEASVLEDTIVQNITQWKVLLAKEK